ncbi:MAG: MazG nucleotide pyrophosphohydrolase domain-containing protein [Candidatus Thorarchaeota archaeon]|jgi:NTP pyrophosphatase (non-canonical NTP hydrolase)
MVKTVKPRNVAFEPNLEEKTKTALHMATYIEELNTYRKNRHRPKNNLYYAVKLAEESGELAEAVLAFEGSRRKVKKLAAQGVTPLQRIKEELGDVVNVAFLLAEQFDIPLSELLDTGSQKLKAKRLKIDSRADG